MAIKEYGTIISIVCHRTGAKGIGCLEHVYSRNGKYGGTTDGKILQIVLIYNFFHRAIIVQSICIRFSVSATSANVYVNTTWNDTGVYLNCGQIFSVSASGTAYYTQKEAGVSPEGSGGGPAICDYILPCAERHCLIGKIGSQKFEIRSSYSGTAPACGTLYLGMNESIGDYGDNSGHWTVAISVKERGNR